MSFNIKQISATANYIADQLFNRSQTQLRQSFCRQFKERFKGVHALNNMVFAVGAPDFAQLIQNLNQQQIQIPAQFRVILYSSGKSVHQSPDGETVIGFFKIQKSKSREAVRLETLLDEPLSISDEHSDDQHSLEDAFRAPPKSMLSQFIDSKVLESIINTEGTALIPSTHIRKGF